MGYNFSGGGEVTLAAGTTLMTLFSTAGARRGYLTYASVGCADAAADNVSELHVQRISAVGTEGSGVTPVARDPDGPVSTLDIGLGAFGVEPTYTAATVLLRLLAHQSNFVQWQTLRERAIITPATTGNGVGLLMVSNGAGATPALQANWGWEE